MKPSIVKGTHLVATAVLLLSTADPATAQTDLGCRTMVSLASTGRPRPVFSDYHPEMGTDDRCVLDKMTYFNGIMTGCAPGLFCVNAAVTREDMAFYLLNGRFPSTPSAPQDPFASASGIFDDVPADYPLACWIEKLYGVGITNGCSGSLGNSFHYCPADAIPRGQMAVFLVKTRHLFASPPFVPPDPVCGKEIFSDVPCTHIFAKWIEALYGEGITAGCATNPLRFCPDSSVTKWEMMVFMRRTFFPGPCS